MPERRNHGGVNAQPAWRSAVPRPWRHNPSQWKERILIAALALCAAALSGYMGLFQWGLLPTVWDPVFHAQSEAILTSDVSHTLHRWFRIPDSALGALAYAVDAVLALAGSTRRWQFRPWLIALFGVSVIPLGGVSVALVAMQAFVVEAWCLLCLVTAALSLALAALAVDEVWSSGLYLGRLWKQTHNRRLCWDAFCGRPSPEALRAAEGMVSMP